MNESKIKQCVELLQSADAILIGAGAGLTAAAGISYTDKEAFSKLFPAWVKKGFSMQYQLMGYTNWTQAEQWGYYTVHLNYVYFQQGSNALYEKLCGMVEQKDYFVMTSNVDQLFHKSGFSNKRIYSPQGNYGKIQCTVPCSDTVWDIKPYVEKMQQCLHPREQVITDPAAIPKCPNCGSNMFINARADHSFIETPYHVEQERLVAWLERLAKRETVLLELGAGYNTPTVIRVPMERITASLRNATLIRVNLEYAEVPEVLKNKSISVRGDIQEFILNGTELFHKKR